MTARDADPTGPDATAPGNRWDMLMHVFHMQEQLELGYGHDFADMLEHQRLQFVKDMLLACEDELHEALQELHWKPWDVKTPPATAELYKRGTPADFQGELVDALHFLICLFLASGMTAEQVYHAYRRKMMRNLDRQASGTYDAMTGKCRRCGVDRLDLAAAGLDPETDPCEDLFRHEWATDTGTRIMTLPTGETWLGTDTDTNTVPGRYA